MLYIPKCLSNIPEELSEDYNVTVNGEECFVHSCRVSAIPFNTIWPGHQRPKNQTELASFISFYSDEAVTLKVKCARSFKKAVVRPLSKKVGVAVNGEEVSFTLTRNGGYTLELDDQHFALHIFFNAPKEYKEKEKATYYFGPGVHMPLLITLKDNDSVYVDPEAIVYTTVYADGAKNVRIYGGGILDNSCQERVSSACTGNCPIGNIRMYNSENIIIEDVILRDSALWILSVFNCNNVVIDGVKLIGHWRYNADGIDLTNTSNAVVKNCFVRSFDDGVVIKAIHNHDLNENIKVDNCVFWCDWGKTIEIGLETAADEYKNIYFKNCDCIHNCGAAMAVSNGHYANIHDIHYENINVEYQISNMPMVYQATEDMIYDGYGKTDMADLLRIDNEKMCSHDFYKDTKFANEKDNNPGKSHDITYKNIQVFTDEGMDPIKINIGSYSDIATVENVSIEDVYINGERAESLDKFRMVRLENLKNVTLNGMELKGQ